MADRRTGWPQDGYPRLHTEVKNVKREDDINLSMSVTRHREAASDSQNIGGQAVRTGEARQGVRTQYARSTAKKTSSRAALAASSKGGHRKKSLAKRRRKRQRRTRMLLILIIILAVIISAVATAIHKKEAARVEEMQQHYDQGVSAFESGDYNSAVLELDTAMAMNTKKDAGIDEASLDCKAEALEMLGDYEGALDIWKQLDATYKQTEYKENTVKCLVQLGRYDEALTIGVLQSMVYNKMALKKLSESDYEGALSDIVSGLAVDDGTSTADLLYNEATIYSEQGDYKRSLEIFESYVEKYGSDENIDREMQYLKTRIEGQEEEAKAEQTETDSEVSEEDLTARGT